MHDDAIPAEAERRPAPAGGERLQNILSHAGVASRRHAADMIAAGRVVVDGRVVTEPYLRFDPAAVKIAVDGRAVSAARERTRTVMLYKPAGVLSTLDDPRGGRTVADLLRGKVRERLVPVGRLDKDSEGLLLMSNDGALTLALTHPRHGHEKTYLVRVAGRWSDEKLRILRGPVAMPDGYVTRPASVEVVRAAGRDNVAVLSFRLREGRKRQIRNMCSAAHLVVLSLKRVAVGALRLPEDLRPGEWRDLTPAELARLGGQAPRPAGVCYTGAMSRIFSFLLLAAGALGVLSGCETVSRARAAQEGVAPATNDWAVASNAAARVDLRGADLFDYAAFALTNRPSLADARLAVSNAVLALRQVTSDRALQVSLAGGYSQATANGGSHFSWRQPRGKGTADVSFDLLLCDFGRIDARELEARENLVAAERDLADGEFDVFNEVAQAYCTLRRNDALLAVARTNAFMHAEHLRESEVLYAAGEAKKLDVLKARVDLSTARLAVINASNDVVTAGAEFLRTLGLEADRATRADVFAVAGDALADRGPGLPATDYDAVAGLYVARTNAPALMVLRAKLRAASARVDYAVADLLPELTLSSAFSFADPAWNWSWGFKAVQTLLDGYRRQIAVDAAVVEMERARTDVEAAEQKLSYDLAVAVATRDNAREALAAASIEVEQARENLETVQAQYNVGDACRLDFTDAADKLADALGARVKSFYAGEAAEAALIRLTGRVPPYAGRAGAGAKENGTHREVTDHEMD